MSTPPGPCLHRRRLPRQPGPGAWAYLLIDPATGKAIMRADGEASTTNNRMELYGVLAALRALRKPGTAIEIRSG